MVPGTLRALWWLKVPGTLLGGQLLSGEAKVPGTLILDTAVGRSSKVRLSGCCGPLVSCCPHLLALRNLNG